MPIPPTMRHVACATAGGPEVMALAQGPVPQPGPGEVLVRVAYAGVNRPDVMQRQGRYPPPRDASPVLGLEVAGRIARCGGDVTAWQPGDRVCALVPGGGYAEYCVVPAGHCLPIPAGLTAAEAAALPETGFTVWANVFERGRLAAGESLLVHGGASGIGTTAIMLAKARGARVFVTVGSADKVRACEGLGADAAINYREQDFVAEVRRLTEGRGVDVILDMVGGPYLERNIAALALDGRLVQIAFQQGSRVTVDFMPLMLKRLTFTGSTMRARSVADKARLADALRREVWPLIEAGRLRPQIYRVFPLAEAAQAHRLMESGEHIGKILLEVDAAV